MLTAMAAMVIPMLTDTMDTIMARGPLSLLLPPHPDTVTDTVVLTVMVIPMLTDTMPDTISARDPLSPVMDILMLMVMVIVPMDIMDMDTATANRFILLP